MNFFRRAIVPLTVAAGLTTAADAAPAVTDLMGNGADAELSAMAVRVAQCAFQHGGRETFDEITPEEHRVQGEVGIVNLRNNGNTYKVVGVDMNIEGMPMDMLLVQGNSGVDAPRRFMDIELDGIPEEGDRGAYAAALRQMDTVCQVSATPQPPIRGRKDCPNPEAGVGIGQLSQFYRKHAVSVVKVTGEMDPDPTDGVPAPWGIPFQCTGTVVGDGLIVTAKHCLYQENPTAETTGLPKLIPNSDIHVEWPAAFDERGNISALYLTHGLGEIHTDDDTDLAVVMINPKAPHLHPAALDINPVPSAPHIAFGHSLEADWTLSVTQGEIFSTGAHWQMQFDEACNVDQGISGGPLLNIEGGVVGTIVGGTTAAEAVLAVPSVKMAPLIRAAQSARIPTGEPVYRCPTTTRTSLLTPKGPQVAIVSDESRCVEVAR